jgi:hypothetical protein
VKLGLKRKGAAVPYGGVYRWTDPITKVEVLGTHWEMLLNRIYDERKANGIPCGLGFEDEVELDLCRDYPAECELNDPRFPKKRGWLSFHEIVAGTRALLKFKLAGSPLVAQEEAERRANICATCPFNVEFQRPCAGLCGELNTLVQAIVGGRQTSNAGRLKSCQLCGCFIGAAIWIPVDIQREVLTDAQREQFDNVDWCWKGKAK